MIRTLNDCESYNPIRSHIKLTFSRVNDYSEKIELIANDLIKNQFDTNKSRVLIFVSVKDKAENAVEELSNILKSKKMPYWDKVDYYHAGLETSEREEKSHRYGKNGNGEIVILIATKAFGMGMDIPNVHFVYHLDPSSNFEDFLQEVGRAGRDTEAYKFAGFDEENPIKTNCIIAKDDFKDLKTKLHKKQINWIHIIQVQKLIYDYVSKFSNNETTKFNAFALPTDLLDQYSEFKDDKFDDTFFRVILYWLEKLKKIKLGTYTPTHLPIKILSENQNYSSVSNAEDLSKIKKFHLKLSLKDKSHLDERGYFMVKMDDLKEFLNVDSNRDVWRLLFLAQKSGALILAREISLEPTLTRKNELEKWDGVLKLPTIESVFNYAKIILSDSKFNEQTHFDGDQLDSMAEATMQKYFDPKNIFWREFLEKSNKERSSEIIAQKLRDDFIKKRAKVSLKLINFLPKGKQTSILQPELGINRPKITQLIFNGYKNAKDWENYLQDFKSDLYALIKYVHQDFFTSAVQNHNIVALLLKLNIEKKGEEYFKQLIFVAKGLGYLKGNSGGIVPMGIELFILDQNIVDLENLSGFEKDTKGDFEESIRMKELRLLALECLSDENSVSANEYDSYC